MTMSTIVLKFIVHHNAVLIFFFFFNDTATPQIYTLSLHDALPISADQTRRARFRRRLGHLCREARPRSEEHTSELQSRQYLVCRRLREKKKTSTSRCCSPSRATSRSSTPTSRGSSSAWPPAYRSRGSPPWPRSSCRGFFFLLIRRPPRSPLFPYTTLFR